jgi:S-DNA-T family DNA segregation ATPase FtsK/SpoIIIE
MLDRQRLTRNGPASALLLAIIFLALSLAHYDPADPPGHTTEPARSSPANPCGPVGATLAHALFTAVGWTSLLVVTGLAAIDLLWLPAATLRRGPARWPASPC